MGTKGEGAALGRPLLFFLASTTSHIMEHTKQLKGEKGMAYLLIAKQLFDANLMGVFSSEEMAKQQKARLDECIHDSRVISLAKTEILEIPYDSTEAVDETIRCFHEELERKLRG